MIRGRLIGIDYGLKRIGLAVCDESWLIARELFVLQRKSKREDFERIDRLVHEQGAVGIVVGLPSDQDATADAYTQADRVRLWVARLKVSVSVPVTLWDETLSSHDAKALARDLRRKKEAPIDDLAARVILQRYLDAVRDGLAVPCFDEDDGSPECS